jgi:putative transposase
MRRTYTQLYVHLIWGTWDRLPLITSEIETNLYSAMMVKIQELNCELVAIGGIDDHVHLLVRLNPTVAVADLIKEIKGSSSHLATHVIMPGQFFKWQGSYSAFSLRKRDLPLVVTYINGQKQHHLQGTLVPEWEESASNDDA